MIENTLSSENDLFPGQILGSRYTIEKKIGAGGMAKVYAAHDQKLKIRTAIKVLEKKHYSDTDFVKRFYREAQTAAKLNHQNIARFYDVNEIDGLHCIVMELVEGRTLEKIIEEKEGFFSPGEACSIAREILNGLEYAHKEGIIPRDIKPGNIMLDTKGNIKITDFGIAKLLPQQDMPEQTLLTKEGSFLGTPLYMSPEQLRSEDVSGMTDVFSTGIVLYQMLTKRLPFENVIDKNPKNSTDHATAMSNILTKGLKRPGLINRKIPQKLEDILLKSLEKNPEERYDANEFHSALNSYLRGEKIKVEGSFKRRFEISRREFLIKSGAAALSLAITIGVPAALITNHQAYEKSLYSTIDMIQEATSWEGMKSHIQELDIKLLDWVLERAQHIKKYPTATDPLFAPYSFQGNITNYTDNLHYGSNIMRDIYEQGFIETGSPEFLKRFAELYELTDFSKTLPYQCYLDRFKISKEMIELLEQNGFEKVGEFKEKMRSATQCLINERYHKTGFFQYINPRDEHSEQQLMYALTQATTMPLLTESVKVFDVKGSLKINFEELLDMIRKQTKTSNNLLIGDDRGVYFGTYFNPFTKEKRDILFQKNIKAYNSYDIMTYLRFGLEPVISLYDEIEKASQDQKNRGLPLERNVSVLSRTHLTGLIKDKEELVQTFFQVLNFYRDNLNKDCTSPEFMQIDKRVQRKELNIQNPPSLSSTLLYFNFINDVLNGHSAVSEYLEKNVRAQFSDERVKLAKVLFHKNSFNPKYNPSKHQSFLKGWHSNPENEPAIVLVQDEKEMIGIKIK